MNPAIWNMFLDSINSLNCFISFLTLSICLIFPITQLRISLAVVQTSLYSGYHMFTSNIICVEFLNDLSYLIFPDYWMHWPTKYQDWSISWPVLTKIIIICWTFNRKLGLFKAFLLSKYIYLTDSWPRRKRKPIKAKL